MGLPVQRARGFKQLIDDVVAGHSERTSLCQHLPNPLARPLNGGDRLQPRQKHGIAVHRDFPRRCKNVIDGFL